MTHQFVPGSRQISQLFFSHILRTTVPGMHSRAAQQMPRSKQLFPRGPTSSIRSSGLSSIRQCYSATRLASSVASNEAQLSGMHETQRLQRCGVGNQLVTRRRQYPELQSLFESRRATCFFSSRAVARWSWPHKATLNRANVTWVEAYLMQKR